MRFTHFRRFVLALIVVAPVVFFLSLSSKVESTKAPAVAPSISATKSVAVVTPPHNNMHPFLALNFIIALQGVVPPRP